MNKEELEKEADTYLDKKYLKDMGVRRPCKQAYLAGAEPREKRIADLEAENEQIKNSDTLCKLIGEQKRKITELEQQIEKMKKYIKACWIEENLNDYSSYITNSSDEFRDLVKELNAEVRNGR